MPQDLSYRRNLAHDMGRIRLLRVALGAALAALVVFANTAAARAGDDDGEESFTAKFMRTLGLKDPSATEYGISYGARSPLVVPPPLDLPPPVQAGPPPAPNWPKDADLKRRADAKAKKKEIHTYNFMEESRALRPDELDKGRGQNAEDGKMAPPGGSDAQGQASAASLAGKKSIFDLNWFKKEEYATFTGEPARTTLTDPPPGYLTPSPDQPYGVGQQGEKAKTKTIGERMEDSGGH